MQFQGKRKIETQYNGEKPRWVQIWAINFYFKNLALSVTRYHGQLSSCTTTEKTNDRILIKTDGQTDRRTDESNFIGCCPTNTEHPPTFITLTTMSN